jgi:uncharacterized phage protein gp47/JayE
MSFRRKTYPEIADNLLNRVLGGVSGETHAFPPPGATRPPYVHALEKSPVADITSVFGLLNGEGHAFAKGVDYELGADAQTLKWKADGALPDAGTVVEVNYLPKQRETRINDLYVGSVVRTLMEAVALETAGLYAQMDLAYQSGFIDTAQGRALDHVVALLGLTRVKAGRNLADVQFKRARNGRGEIYLPAGTRVLNADASIEYETLGDTTMIDGQDSLKVAARDLVDTNDGVNADTLTLLAKPIAGIESVTNPSASTQLDRDESDDELRARAKSFLAGSERGTLGALKAVLAAHNLRGDIDESTPGEIVITLKGDALSADDRQRLITELNQARPAGVRLTVPETMIAATQVDLSLRLSTTEGLLDADLRRIQADIQQRLADYLNKLPTSDNARVSKLIGLAMNVPGVEDATVVSVALDGTEQTLDAAGNIGVAGKATQLRALTLTDPAMATTLALTVRFPRKTGAADTAIPDQAKLQNALQTAITYLNLANQTDATDAATTQMRGLSLGKLAAVLPLPGVEGVLLEDLDTDIVAGTAAALPTVASLNPYSLQWVLTRPNGVSQVMDADAASFTLAAWERLSLGTVAVQVKPKD